MAANGQRVRPAAVRTTTHLLHSPRSSSPTCTPPPPSPCRSQSLSGHRVRHINPARVCYSLRHPLVLYRSPIGDRHVRPCGEHSWIDRSVHNERRASELMRSDGTEHPRGTIFVDHPQSDPEGKITTGGGRVQCSGVGRRRSHMWLVPRIMYCS